MATLSNVYVNIAGSASDNVLRDGTGTSDGDNRVVVTGTVVDSGPQEDGVYVVGSSEAMFYDVTMVSRVGDRYVFEKK